MEVIAAEFARMAGVSRAAISGKIKNGTIIQNSAGKIDTDNPVNRAYIDRKHSDMKTSFETHKMEQQVLNSDGTADLKKLSMNTILPGGQIAGKATQTQGIAATALDMTVRELIMKHGSLENVERYSKILRDLTAADERDQKIQERRLIQIPKDFVVSRLFNFEDELMNKLLDVPESICDQIIALALADGETKRQDIINLMSDHLTRCIAGSKEHVINELNSLKGKYENQDADTADMVQELTEQIDTLKENN